MKHSPLRNQLVWHAKSGYPLTHKQRGITRRLKAQAKAKPTTQERKQINKDNVIFAGLAKFDRLFNRIGMYVSP